MMFERFTNNARKAMALANAEAQRFGHDYVGANHLVLGLIKNSRCSAHAMLARCGVDIVAFRAHIEALDPTRIKADKSDLSPLARGGVLMPGAKRFIEHAIAESRLRGDDYIGTEHMITGAARIVEGPWSDTWKTFQVDPEQLWKAREGLTREDNVPEPIAVQQTRAPEPVGAYPTARRVGNLLFLSGQGPRQRGSKDIPGVVLDASGKMLSYDIAAQVRAVFQNVKYVLEENGSSMDRIVDVTCFLTNLEKDFAGYNTVYAELFPPGPNQPCRTTLGISSLPQGANAPIAFEAKVVATV